MERYFVWRARDGPSLLLKTILITGICIHLCNATFRETTTFQSTNPTQWLEHQILHSVFSYFFAWIAMALFYVRGSQLTENCLLTFHWDQSASTTSGSISWQYPHNMVGNAHQTSTDTSICRWSVTASGISASLTLPWYPEYQFPIPASGSSSFHRSHEARRCPSKHQSTHSQHRH